MDCHFCRTTYTLLHICDDAKNFGPLDCFSAFPYENNMRLISRLCRKPNQPLQQIVLRLMEQENSYVRISASKKSSNRCLQPHTEGPVSAEFSSNCIQYRSIENDALYLCIAKRNNCCMLRDSSICIVANIVIENSVHFLVIRKLSKIESFYDVGLSSELFEIFKCSLISTECSLVRLSEVYKKCYLMPLLQKKHDHKEN